MSIKHSSTSQKSPSPSSSSSSASSSGKSPQNHPATKPYIRRPGNPIQFSDLHELHPLILSYIKILHPQILLPVSRDLYNELLPKVYTKIKLNKYNTMKLFYGYSPIPINQTKSRNGFGSKSTSGRGYSRSSSSTSNIGGLKDFSMLDDLTPLSSRSTSERGYSRRLSNSSHHHYDKRIKLSSNNSNGNNNNNSTRRTWDPERNSVGQSIPLTRKLNALNLINSVELEDAESLSIICQFHMEYLSYSPIFSGAGVNSDTNNNNNNNLSHEISTHLNKEGEGEGEERLYQWPLNNVKTLSIKWELMKYLIDSHSNQPICKQLPICCIPFQIKTLIIEIKPLFMFKPNLNTNKNQNQNQNHDRNYQNRSIEIETKQWLRSSLQGLSSEFVLEELILDVKVPFDTISSSCQKILVDGHQQQHQHQPQEEEEDENDGDEIYIPPIEYPPPALEILIIISSYSPSSTSSTGCATQDQHQHDSTEKRIQKRYSKIIFDFLEDTGRRNFKIPPIQIAISNHNQIGYLVKHLIFGLDLDEYGQPKNGRGVARSVGERALKVTSFIDINEISGS
ncbi:uncharacterized protein L201_001481 [Kwoniella dendrophila CBS 6074]|uniref:Uncharacterized protein n=1 Tax=Kwoniella dendrophila CBS 6074 TaxID=1295534 RepID=A0AAX4JPD1_9TREE